MIFFDLMRSDKNYSEIKYKNNHYYSMKKGYIFGEFSKKFPESYTILYRFYIFFVYGLNAQIIDFGSRCDNNGIGVYINANYQLILRINQDIHHINIKIKPETYYNIAIIKTKDNDVMLFVNNELKFKIRTEIHDFYKYGMFNKISVDENNNEYIKGIISNIEIHDVCFNQNNMLYLFD